MKTYFTLLVLLLSLFVTSVSAQTVYTTKTGTKYHTENCRYLSKSKITISLENAISKGLGACKVCKPPVSVKSIQNSDKSKATTKSTPTPTKATTVESVKQTKSISKQCSAKTQSGNRCKRMTKSPNGKCWQHGGN